MQASALTATSCTATPLGSHGIADRHEGAPTRGRRAAESWVEPGTGQRYPVAYPAYRRTREAEEKPLARHRKLGPDIDHYVWRQWQESTIPDVEVVLIVRPDAPPRLRRIVSGVLCAIRRGQPAGEAIRQVAGRFGLRQMRARACIKACLGFEVRPREEVFSR